MKKVIVFFVFVFVTTLFPQEIIFKGMVRDSKTLSPLNLASVFTNNQKFSTLSDSKGEFELKINNQDFSYIRIKYLGYKDFQIQKNDVKSNNAVVINLEPVILTSQSVAITASIGKEGVTPSAFSKIEAAAIKENYSYQDVPEYLSHLPSTTFYSENGNGIGYNYISIRGFDQRRISVSVNGIPQNEPEDHNVYWLDFADILGNTDYIQVQRGAGANIISYPSVGGSINIITTNHSVKPQYDVSASAGAYNFRKYSASVSSGLVDNKYSFFAKFSKMLSSGYRNMSWTDFNSFYLSAIRYDENFTTQLNIYGGPVSDGLAYTGLPKFAVKDKDLRKKNYSYWEADNNSFGYTLDRKSGEVENFSQPHYEILNEWKISDNTVFNSALFLITGEGFFTYDGSWADTSYFRLTTDNGFNAAGNPVNALIKAQVENVQYGWMPKLKLEHGEGTLIIGGDIRIHRSLHWGGIDYAENLPAGVDKDYRYYQYKGGKDMIGMFAQESYNINDKINVLAEVQLPYVKYKIFEEKYNRNDFTVDNLFFNFKAGANYKPDGLNNIYFSVSKVSREPRLKNYYDAAESSGGEIPQFETKADGTYDFSKPLVKPENMFDLELGYGLEYPALSLNCNVYYMFFKDEIVANGRLDRFGQPMTGNMESTIHRGVEFSANYKPVKGLNLYFNATYSKNYINKGNVYIKYKDNGIKKTDNIDLADNRIGGFPDFLANAIAEYKTGDFTLQFTAKYVGKNYSDYYDEKLAGYIAAYPGFIDYSDNVVDSYFCANIFGSVNFSLGNQLNKSKLFFQINNIFNTLYAAKATGKEFFPAAERNIVAGIQFSL
jgi:iron complex outermembrane receptor protein